jgi:dTDP-4-amino-4,6-dideoxygalactose transaminase
VQAASHFTFPVLAADRAARDAARDRLEAAGVETAWYPALHRLEGYGDGAAALPVSEEVADRLYCLPLSPSVGEDDLDAIAREVAADG